MFAAEALEEALRTVGDVLADNGQSCAVLVVGGANLLLLGVVARPTADVDVIGTPSGDTYVPTTELPAPLVAAAREVAAVLQLQPDWINTGPVSLFDFGLPEGYESRVVVRRYGGLDVHFAGRFDLICFKLYAAVDHSGQRVSKHLDDLRALRPTAQELRAAASWTVTHDPSSGFRSELSRILGTFGTETTGDAI